MISINNLSEYNAGLPLLADDIVEFHAARLLLLLELVGTNGIVKGLTKLAKLDFFVRYPEFFSKMLNGQTLASDNYVESSMIRYRYGPWDPRYYDILGYLEAKGLLEVAKISSRTFQFKLTALGRDVATKLVNDKSYEDVTQHMLQVKKILGSKTGSQLKELVYNTFDKEVAQLPLGETIRS